MFVPNWRVRPTCKLRHHAIVDPLGINKERSRVLDPLDREIPPFTVFISGIP